MARIDTLPHFLEDVANSIKNKLGSEYQQVEYIESTGTQYIDTGVTPGTNIQIETEVEVTTTNMNIPVFGCYYNGTTSNTLGNYYHLTPYNNKWYFGGNNTEGNGGTYDNVVRTKYNIKFNDLNSNLVVNGSSISTGMTFTGYSGSTIAIGRRGGNTNTLYGVYKYYRFKMYDKTTLTYIRDFIPCYRVDDGEIGLYDLVSEQFYPNNGIGTFLKGPDVKELPSEYQEVEYIASNGGQYIDTGFVPDNNTSVEVKIRAYNNTDNGWVFGARQAANDTMYGIILNNDGYNYPTTIRSDYGTGGINDGAIVTYNTGQDLTTVTKVILKDKNNIYVNDSLVAQNTAQTFTCPVNLYLFKINSANGGNHNSYTKMYYAKIWDDGVLIRHYIPCYRKSDGAIGMYDLVNGTFNVNGGTDTFVTGDDIVKLPNEYQEVEYIESSGTQYIQTGYTPKQNTKIYVKMSPTSSGTFGEYPIMFGAQNTQYGTGGNFVVFYNSNHTINARTGQTTTNIKNSDYSVTVGNIYEIELSFNKLVINGTTYADNVNTWVDFVYPINIFTRSNTPVSGETYTMADKGKSPYKLYTFKCYEDSILVRNFVPCYRKSDDEIGVYDLVSGQFYTNSGTGTFLKGSAKNIPDEYQELEYIESSGTQYIDTGIKLSTNFEVNIKWKTQILSVRQAILSSYNVSVSQSVKDYWCFELRADNTFRWVTWQEDESETGSASIDTIYDSKIVCNSGNATIYRDGVQQTTLSNLTNAMFNLLLFDDYRHNTFTDEKICVYSCSIINNGVLVRDFIPCYRKEDNAVGMYDMVTNTFFENSGTGEFIKGAANNPILPEAIGEISASDFDVYIDSIPNTPLNDFFNGDFANSEYTKDAAGLKSFFDTEYFNPKYYPLAVDVNQKITSSSYKDDKTAFCIPSLLNMAYACDKAFNGCNNIILPPNFEITIPAGASRPADMFGAVYAYNLTGQNITLTLNAQTYWPDGMFYNSYRVGEGPTANTKYFDITYNFIGSSNSGTLGNMFAFMARNNPDLASTSEQSNYIVTMYFKGLSNWNGFSGTSWNDNEWDYYSRIVGGCGGKVLNVDGLKFTTQTYRTHRMFQDCLCSQINLINCSFTGAYNFKRWFYNCPNLTTIDLSTISNTHPSNVQEMFAGCTSLTHIDLRTFTLSSATTYTDMFGADATVGVPDNCEIIVANDTQKTWVQGKFSRLTNVKTITEYEGGN